MTLDRSALLGSCKDGSVLDESDSDQCELDLHAEAAVLNYLEGLPSFFEDDPAPPFYDDIEQMEREFAQLDYDGIKKCAVNAMLRFNDALNELLDQEHLLGETLTEAYYLESQLNAKEKDLAKADMKLQAANNSISLLLREKADTLQKLIEAKKELANMNTIAAGLQQDLEARVRSENELRFFLANYPRASVAITESKDAAINTKAVLSTQTEECNQCALQKSCKSMRNEGLLTDPTSRCFLHRCGRYNMNAALSGLSAKTLPSVSDLQKERSFCKVYNDGSREHRVTFVGAVDAGDNFCGNSSECAEWSAPFLESQRQNQLLVSEHACVRARHCNSDNVVAETNTPVGESGISRSFPRGADIQLRRGVAEFGRLEQKIGGECERKHGQGQLEMRLLKDVTDIAHGLLRHEGEQGVTRGLRQADLSLSREELLVELSRCRLALGGLGATAVPGDDGDHPQGFKRGTADGLAAALRDAIEINETLQAEKDVAVAEKREAETSYKLELRSRVEEMGALFTALSELREKVRVLKNGSPSIVLSSDTRLERQNGNIPKTDKRLKSKTKTETITSTRRRISGEGSNKTRKTNNQAHEAL